MEKKNAIEALQSLAKEFGPMYNEFGNDRIKLSVTVEKDQATIESVSWDDGTLAYLDLLVLDSGLYEVVDHDWGKGGFIGRVPADPAIMNLDDVRALILYHYTTLKSFLEE